MSIPFFDKRFGFATDPPIFDNVQSLVVCFLMASLRDRCLHPYGLQEVHICMRTHGLTGSTHLTNGSLRLTNHLNQNLQTHINSPLPFRMPVLSKSVPMTYEEGTSWLLVIFQVSQNFAIFIQCFIEYLTLSSFTKFGLYCTSQLSIRSIAWILLSYFTKIGLYCTSQLSIWSIAWIFLSSFTQIGLYCTSPLSIRSIIYHIENRPATNLLSFFWNWLFYSILLEKLKY